MMQKSTAQEMFRQITRRVNKYTEGHPGTLNSLAGTAGKVENRIAAFLELKDSAPAAQVLSSAERLKAEFERLKSEVMTGGIAYDINLEETMLAACGIAEIDAFGKEVRDKAAKLDPAALIMLIQEAIKTKDTQVLSALIHPYIPAFLTGLKEEDRAQFRDQLFKTHASTLFDTRKAAREAFDLTEMMIRQALEIVTSTLVMPELHAEAAKTVKRGAAEAALNG